MVNSLTQFQNEFGKGMCWSISILLLLLSLVLFSSGSWIIGLIFGSLGAIIIWVIKKYEKELTKK